MPLLDLFKSLVGLRSKVAVDEAWAESPESFSEHFNVSYEEFEERLSHLDRAHIELYEKTLEVNPEAAVTWVFWVDPS